MKGEATAPFRYKLALFDLGGVLIELSGVPVFRRWTGDRYSDEQVWEVWLRSPAVRAFESGRCSPAEFADRIIEEMRLPVGPSEFLAAFASWPTGLLPGAREMLVELRGRCRLASMSNTNEVHWPRFVDEFGLGALLDDHYPSHLTGLLKPDRRAFENVVQRSGFAASEIIFLDDNRINVRGAQSAGLTAFCAKGVAEARAAFERA